VREEGEPRNTVTKRHDHRTRVEAVLGGAPRWPRTAGHVKDLGSLTPGDTLGVQSAIPLKPLSAFEASPAWVALLMVTLLILASCAHRSLLLRTPLSGGNDLAKDGEGALLGQP
jgi:hypothetical protein